MAARELCSEQTLTCEWSNARELYLTGRVKDAALEAVKDSLLDRHMKSALDGNFVASPARGLDLTSGGSTPAEKVTSISSTRLLDTSVGRINAPQSCHYLLSLSNHKRVDNCRILPVSY